MSGNLYIYFLIMIGVIFLIRALPLTLIRKQIKNPFIKSFLYYVPYVTLAVMTFPAIIDATDKPIAGLLALLGGIVAAWCGMKLLSVSVICCIIVLAAEFLIR